MSTVQRDMAMFELGLRDYGSSWTRLQEALRAQQQLGARQEEPPEARPRATRSEGGEDKSSKGKPRAGLIGLITRRRDGRKKDKRASKASETHEAKEPSSEEDAKPEPKKSSSPTGTAQKDAPEQQPLTPGDEKRNSAVTPQEKCRERSQSPIPAMRTREHFEPENGLSREAFLSDLAAGSHGSDSRGRRRQVSPSDKEGRRFPEDRSQVANDRLEPCPVPLAPDKAPRGRKVVAGTKEDNFYRRHRQRSFKDDLLSHESADTVDHEQPSPQQRQSERVYRERSFVQPRSSNELRREPTEMLRGQSLTRPAEPEFEHAPQDRARRELSPSGQENGDARRELPSRRRTPSAHRADRRVRRHADAEASPVDHAWEVPSEMSNGRSDPNPNKIEKSRHRAAADHARDEGGSRESWDEGPRDGGRRVGAREGGRPERPQLESPSGNDGGCTRCGDRVYPKELVTPKPGVLFHSGCFKCRECGVKLTLQTFFTNQRDTRDADVYCRTHVPRLGPGTVDGNALNILTSRNSREIKFTRYPRADDAEAGLPSQDDP